EAWLNSGSTAPQSRTITLPASQVLTSLKAWVSASGTVQVASTGNATRVFTLSSTKTTYTTGWTTASPTVVVTITGSNGAGSINLDDLTYGALGPNAAPTVATPAAATPNPATAMTTNLSVLGADDGGEPNLTYTWAATGTPPGPVSF